MGELPDEIWMHILRSGLKSKALDYRDMCSLAITCMRLRLLTALDCLWISLWNHDLPHHQDQLNRESFPSTKAAYRSRFEKVKAAKSAARKRHILRAQSQCHVLDQDCKNLELSIQREREKLRATLSELRTMERARQASIALQLWQPQMVRTMHEKVIEQQRVNNDAHHHSLNMEVKVCREQIDRFEKSIRQKKCSIERIKKELESLTYNPLESLTYNPLDDHHEGSYHKENVISKSRKRKLCKASSISSV